MDLDDDYADEDEYTEWELDPLGVDRDLVIRGDEDLATYATRLWETNLDEELLLWLLLLGAEGAVLPGTIVVHDLPDLPEPVDVPGIAGLLRSAVAHDLVEDAVTAVSVVVWLPPDGLDGTSARAWAGLVRDAVTEAGLPLRGVVAITDEGEVRILRTTSPEPLD